MKKKKPGMIKSGVVAANVLIGKERRVMVFGSMNVDVLLRKLKSRQKLGQITGRLGLMCEKYHAGKILFGEVCRCGVGDIENVMAQYKVKLAGDGYVVWDGATDVVSKTEVCVYPRRYMWVLDEVVGAMARGTAGEEILRDLERIRLRKEKDAAEEGPRCGVVTEEGYY